GVRALNAAHGRIESVELDNGATVSADTILSSAGAAETLLLCSDLGREMREDAQQQAGAMTFMESISVLDTLPENLGHATTIVFFNNSERFVYRPPEDYIDPRSGVICCPSNFQYAEPLAEGCVRVTSMANYELWKSLPADSYRAKKD